MATQTAAASKALKRYLASKTDQNAKSQLFESDAEFVYLVIRSKRFFNDHRQLKPQLVELPISLFKYKKSKLEVLLFCRDPQREFKDALIGNSAITKVVGVSKLKGKHRPYEARRLLAKEHDLFLGEDGCVEMLPKLLGSVFYRKLQNIPLCVKLRNGKQSEINVERANEKINKILHSTVISYPASDVMMVRIGTVDHSDKELAKNVETVFDCLGEHKKNVIELSIRTNQSPTLPVWYSEKCYSESDIGDEDDSEFETEGMKRKREEEHLDELLAEVVDEEEIKNYNKEQKKRRKRVAGEEKEIE